jgi:hypothetical protein
MMKWIFCVCAGLCLAAASCSKPVDVISIEGKFYNYKEADDVKSGYVNAIGAIYTDRAEAVRVWVEAQIPEPKVLKKPPSSIDEALAPFEARIEEERLAAFQKLNAVVVPAETKVTVKETRDSMSLWLDDFTAYADESGVVQYQDKAYDKQVLRTATAVIQQVSDAWLASFRPDLIEDVNKQFDRRIANLDSYLDYYYKFDIADSLFGPVVTLINLGSKVKDEGLSGGISKYNEEEIAKQEAAYDKYINAGVDAKKMDALLIRAEKELDDVVEPFNTLLSRCALENADMTRAETWDEFPALYPVEMVGELAGGLHAAGLSTVSSSDVVSDLAIGVAGDQARDFVLAKTVAAVAGKTVTKTAGIVFGVVMDFAVNRASEAINRKTFKAQLENAINTQRDAALLTVDPSYEAPFREPVPDVLSVENIQKQMASAQEFLQSDALSKSVDAASEGMSKTIGEWGESLNENLNKIDLEAGADNLKKQTDNLKKQAEDLKERAKKWF